MIVAPSSVSAALESVTLRLEAAGCESARVDAELLVAHVLGTSRSGLYADSGRGLAEHEAALLETHVARRERREPLAYVLGEWGFRRLLLRVDGRALVPRPETEIVVERALALVDAISEPRVLDVGTGSGAIALAIADERPGARVLGIDSSRGALALAWENVERTDLGVELREWDLFDGLPAGPWDLVVSNPPYVTPAELETLEPEVREWEPREALVGEGATQAIAQSAFEKLRERGALVLEAAEGTGRLVAEQLVSLGYDEVRVTRDLTGRDRVVEGRR